MPITTPSEKVLPDGTRVSPIEKRPWGPPKDEERWRPIEPADLPKNIDLENIGKQFEEAKRRAAEKEAAEKAAEKAEWENRIREAAAKIFPDRFKPKLTPIVEETIVEKEQNGNKLLNNQTPTPSAPPRPAQAVAPRPTRTFFKRNVGKVGDIVASYGDTNKIQEMFKSKIKTPYENTVESNKQGGRLKAKKVCKSCNGMKVKKKEDGGALDEAKKARLHKMWSALGSKYGFKYDELS